jgi:hypothetical protein
MACLMFLGAELWSSQQHFTIREVMQGTPRLIGAGCGLVLFVSSLACFGSVRWLAFLGFNRQRTRHVIGVASYDGIQLITDPVLA